MDIKNLGCINPYTGLLTSKKVTNVENRREICEFMYDATKITPISLEDLMGRMGKPLNLVAKTAAQDAYERQIAANKTYEFADERMKKRITHLSNYYLSTVPESVKEAWQETMEESGVNPFSDGFSTLAQLVMEQDLMTGGDDNIFGNTIESSLAATKKILDRIENPLGRVDEDKAESLQREKKFYSTLLRKLEKTTDATLHETSLC